MLTSFAAFCWHRNTLQDNESPAAPTPKPSSPEHRNKRLSSRADSEDYRKAPCLERDDERRVPQPHEAADCYRDTERPRREGDRRHHRDNSSPFRRHGDGERLEKPSRWVCFVLVSQLSILVVKFKIKPPTHSIKAGWNLSSIRSSYILELRENIWYCGIKIMFDYP